MSPTPPPNQSPATCLVAARKIPEGCKISVSYLSESGLTEPHELRQVKLKGRWKFVCVCKRCTQEDGCGLIVDSTRKLKCRSCNMGTRVGLVGGSLFGPCSNANCNQKIKIKNLVKRKDLNGVIATLGAKCESTTDSVPSTETERYEITIKLSNDLNDMETKKQPKNITSNFKVMSLKRSCFEFINVEGTSDAISEKPMYSDKLDLESDHWVIKDDILCKLETKIVNKGMELAKIDCTGRSNLTVINEFLSSASEVLCESHWMLERTHTLILNNLQYKEYTKNKHKLEHVEKVLHIWNHHVNRLSEQRSMAHVQMGDLFRTNGEFPKSVKHYLSALRELSLIYSTGQQCYFCRGKTTKSCRRR